MPVLFIYLIKANIALTLFYLAYRFGLRRLTFYTLNRLFLLAGITLATIFPLININDFFRNHQQLAGSVVYYAPDWHSLQRYMQPASFTVWNLIQYIFWAGVAVMAVRLFVQLLSLLRIHLRTTSGMLNNESVKLMQDPINPFSFFKNIYINPSLHTDGELKDIIAHERIHIKGWHTLDVLAGEINNIFYWFNPGAWLMKTAIRENLEFITDRKILESGADAKAYQYSLIKISSAPFAIPVANHFNLSHLKARIMMMNKKRSSGFHLLRYLLLLPVITVVIVVFTSAGKQQVAPKTVPPSVTAALHKEAPQSNLAIRYGLTQAFHRSYTASLQSNPSVKRLVLPWAKDHLSTIAVVGRKQGQSRGTASGFLADRNDPNTISRYAAQQALQANGRKKNDPRVRNFLKLRPENEAAPLKQVKFTPTALKKNPGSKSSAQQENTKTLHPYRFTLSKTLPKEGNSILPAIQFFPAKPAVMMPPARQVLVYLKDIKASNLKREEYNGKNRAKNRSDVIVTDTVGPHRQAASGDRPTVKFTPPKVVKDTAVTPDNPFKLTGKDRVLYFVDGKRIDSNDLKAMKGKDIASISVLKGASAVSLYGEKGKNGVILIKTKAQADKDRASTPPVFTPHNNTDTAIGKPLYIKDGKIMEGHDLKKINPKDIKSIMVLKGKEATARYGDKGKNGAVLIITKAKTLTGKDTLKTFR